MNFSACTNKSENFAQCQQNLARMYPCVSVIFRNSAVNNFNLQANGFKWLASWLKRGINFWLIGCLLWPFIMDDISKLITVEFQLVSFTSLLIPCGVSDLSPSETFPPSWNTDLMTSRQ